MGGLAALAVVIILTPASMSTADSIPLWEAMAKIAAWIIGPSMLLTVVAGLLAIAATPGFQDAGWVWAKAATGILILQGCLHVLGPIQAASQHAAGALAASPDPTGVARLLKAEGGTLWLLLAVSVANIALGVWRPRLPKIPI
jgi:hypothetical protein